MVKRGEAKRERKSLKSLSVTSNALVLAMMFAAAGCTKHKEDKDNTLNVQSVSKLALCESVSDLRGIGTSECQGKLFSLSYGVEEADSYNGVGAVPGFSNDWGFVRATITEDELQFKRAFGANERPETATIIASFPIKAHYDIGRVENDFKETTNVIDKLTDRPWDKRALMEVDWAHPTIKLASVNMQLGGTDGVSEENVRLVEQLKIDSNNYISWAVESNVNNSKVLMRAHLMPVKSTDFVPNSYPEQDFYRFGYFTNEQNIEDPYHGALDKDTTRLAEVFNVCEPGAKFNGKALSCSTNKIVWHLTKDFPKQYLDGTRQSIQDWNLTFKTALKRTDDVIVLNETFHPNMSDPNYNIIAYYDPQAGGGLLGVAQGVTDPRTGEKLSARATVYGAGIRYEMGRAEDLIDMLNAEGTDGEALAESLLVNQSVPEVGPVAGSKLVGKSTVKEISALDKIKASRKLMGIDKIKPLSSQSLKAQTQAVFGAPRGSTVTTPMGLNPVSLNLRSGSLNEGVETATSKRDSVTDVSQNSTLAKKFVYPAFMSGFRDGKDPIAMTYGPNLLKLPSQSNQLKNGLRDLMNLPSQLRAEKKLSLKMGLEARGVHGSEFVEEAAIRYLLKLLKNGQTPKDLLDNKKQIMEDVAKYTFYTTLLHEMGHTFGLRHNFAGSSDRRHFTDKYKEIAAKLAKGDKSVVPEDLDPAAYSSIMDYGNDFYIGAGGLGPYDKAAIQYGYVHALKRNVDPAARDATPVANDGYRFCTDHQVGESILCKRFDKGTNATEVMRNSIETSKRNYILNHFRRGRANFESIAASLPARLYMGMLEKRQAIDELVYALITSPSNAEGCQAFTLRSVKLGEMADICDRAAAEDGGVVPYDVSTYINALFDPATGQPLKDPASYSPYGMADLLMASQLAIEFFADTIGAPEAGVFLVEKDATKSVAKLSRITDLGGDVEQALTSTAQDRGVKPSEIAAYIEQNKNNVREIGVGKLGKLIDFGSSGDVVSRLDHVGFIMDKYVALLALGQRDLGVQKYADASMTGNAYLYPHTKSAALQLMNKVITRDPHLSIVQTQIVNADGSVETVLASPEASMKDDLRDIATMVTVVDFQASKSLEILDLMHICDQNDQSCAPGPGQEVAKYASNGTTVYSAVNSDGNGSIAFSLLSETSKVAEKRDRLKKIIADRPAEAARLLDLVKSNDGVRAKLEKAIGADQDLKDLKDLATLADPNASKISFDVSKGSAWDIQVWFAANSEAIVDQNFRFRVLNFVQAKLGDLQNQTDVVFKTLQDLDQLQCAEADVSADCVKKRHYTEVANAVVDYFEFASSLLNDGFESMLAKEILSGVTSDLANREADISLIRQLRSAVRGVSN